MRQFILAKSVATSVPATLDEVTDGAIGLFYNKDGVLTVDGDGTKTTKEAMLVLGRPKEKGGPVVFPVFKNNFSYVKGEYEDPTVDYFTATLTIPAPTRIGDYSLIVVKKGLKFNERNKWTAVIHVHDVTMTADTLAAKLAKAINNNIGSEVEAITNGAALTITGKRKKVDYEIVGADLLFDYSTIGFKQSDYAGQFTTCEHVLPVVYGDVEYVKDLAEKAAADAGFEYTYRDAYYYLYPNYPLNPLAQDDAKDEGYVIFTLRFAEPRDVKTRDEVVNQIVQVAFPKSADYSTFETICKGLAGVTATA